MVNTRVVRNRDWLSGRSARKIHSPSESLGLLHVFQQSARHMGTFLYPTHETYSRLRQRPRRSPVLSIASAQPYTVRLFPVCQFQ